MHSSQVNKNKNDSGQRSFSPFVAHTLEVEGYGCFYYDSVCYNEKHNLIISCPTPGSLQFYDATTLLPSEEFETQKFEWEVLRMSFCPATETLIFECNTYSSRTYYTYNLSKKTLEKPIKQDNYEIGFSNSSFYAISILYSNVLFVRNFVNGKFFRFPLKRRDIDYLKSLQERNLLFSSLEDGSMMIYRTDKLPKLPILDSIQGDNNGSRDLQRILINGKDYILSRRNYTIEIWHFLKGKMRRLKVIQMPEEVGEVSSVVYLENYKMIATTHNTNEVRFWRLPSGKLEYTLDVGLDKYFDSFLMKDKNALGVVCGEDNLIKIIQLHPQKA